MGILAVITAPIVGRLMPRIDARWIVSVGMAVLAASFFMRAHMTTQADYWSVAIPMLVLGAGVPACIICLTSLGVSDLPDDKVTNGAGLQNFLRIMSMAVGASLTQTYWEQMSRLNRVELVSAIDPSNVAQIAEGARRTLGSEASAMALLSRQIDAQAVMLATNDFYAMATILMLACICAVWLIKRQKGTLKAIAH
jgi:DHA2 family multidrug resistance protein